MNTKSRQLWMVIGGAVVLVVTFAVGYVVGSKTQKSALETINTLNSKDMDHAFSSIKPAEHETMTQEPSSQSLSSLVAGLEKKVVANPENIDQQLLLAQTYNELGNRTKSLNLLRAVDKQAPKNVQIKITLATILMKGEDKQELKESIKLFDEAIKLKPDVASMARMYQGEIRVKLDSNAKQ